ncbi:MAG: UDP-N-acetylmuramoyl-L-alanine--D-glutamate ligase [Candidatus Omnitrophica bacterium]|nr:UDP-N-acetylmuramoyl-L-alanine--D-glutamate ligase [Candidatus Omnitrophota bacterium]
MRNVDYFKGKKVLVVGLARSGVACARLLCGLGAEVTVTDIKDDVRTRQAAGMLDPHKVRIELGSHNRDTVLRADLVVVSPGVPADSLCVKWAHEAGRPVIGEVEAAAILCPARIVAVTGSNGKTTVTTLIGKVLEADKRKVFVCGNIGNPFCGEVEKMGPDDFAVLEISSFQLETIKTFKPEVALILNLTQNHLDRYPGMREYLDAKKRIFMNQDRGDFLVVNADDPVLKAVSSEALSKVIFFSRYGRANPNYGAVEAVAGILGVSPQVYEKVFAGFKGIEHRMEEVGETRGVTFINDSKATTADSAVWAISNIKRPVILIAGGRHKGIDYRVILKEAEGKVKYAVLIGEARDIIASDLGAGGFPVVKAASLEEAVTEAYRAAGPGDCVLFSPMCSSYDMFTDYEQRGRVFKKIVADLLNREALVNG